MNDWSTGHPPPSTYTHFIHEIFIKGGRYPFFFPFSLRTQARNGAPRRYSVPCLLLCGRKNNRLESVKKDERGGGQTTSSLAPFFQRSRVTQRESIVTLRVHRRSYHPRSKACAYPSRIFRRAAGAASPTSGASRRYLAKDTFGG